jgi:acetoacetyl-CoA synthetase
MSAADAPLWTPSRERVEAAQLWPFIRRIDRDWDARLAATADADPVAGYAALHAWTVAHPEQFWAAVWDHCDVPGERGERLLLPGAELRQTRFLPDARLSVAQALLPRDGDAPALIFAPEDGETAELSWSQLRRLVGRLQRALLADGVAPGDRVAALMSNRPETYALMIATASIGAVFTSVSPDFGTAGVLDRFAQVNPVTLVAVSRYPYGGKEFPIGRTLSEVAAGLPELRRLVVLGDPPAVPEGGGGGRRAWTPWPEWVEAQDDAEPRFETFAFDHPWYVLYSSGTTGAPKCIVHRAGGVLLKHLAEHRLQHDLGPGDRLCYFTTAGWMMWNWQASALASGAALVLADGSPFHPTPNALFDLIDARRITVFGTSARYLDACAKAGLRPRETHDLGSLRTVLSTGSPLSADGFGYVYDAVKADVHLQPISGGTDLCGVLVGSQPTAPVYAGEMPCAALGIDADVVGEDGASLPPGERGELVVRNAFPSMPLGFWGDDDGSRYRAAYFERFPGMWHHGDFAERTERGGFVIIGRSDATLNPGGVRIGTAEIYRQVATFPEVLESLAIGQEVAGDTRVVLFVQLREGAVLDDQMQQEIRQRIRGHLSPRHVPALIVQAPDLPRTRSGKLSEIAVRDVVAGRSVANSSALANPQSLDFFRDVPELAER